VLFIYNYNDESRKKIGMRIIGRPEVLPGDVERLAVAKAAADVDGEGRRYDGGRR
jgi:hypothetical protein